MKWLVISLILAGALVGQPRRVTIDAHNCYPENSLWLSRLERALGLRVPIAIEQDLAWDPEKKKSAISHETIVLRGSPDMRYYFLERVRPIVETALETGRDKERWPLITLNIDFKTLEPEHVKAVYDLLYEYRDWLTSAPKQADGVAALDIKPLMVLVGDHDEAEKVFNGDVPRLIAFGAAKLTPKATALTPVKSLVTAKATNYRRWVNIPWPLVEPGGQKAAASWTPAEELRLNSLVKHAHDLGYWMRVYTLNGHDPKASQGWNAGYNVGTLAGAQKRWEAAGKAGVDFVATDQYEELFKTLKVPQLSR